MRKRWLGRLLLFCAAGVLLCAAALWRELRPRIEAEKGYDDVRSWAFAESSGQSREADRPDADSAGDAGSADDDFIAAYRRRGAPDFEALQKWNPDVCGWIWLPGTDIDYPVVQGSDNTYYLTHTSDKKKSVIGSVFMESANDRHFSDDVTALYGHHIKGGRMFSALSNYKKQAYYDKHPYMVLYTPEKTYRAELFAGQILHGGTGGFPLKFAGRESRDEWIKQTLAASTFESKAVPGTDERILALATCSYEFRDARYAVYGVLRELETIT